MQGLRVLRTLRVPRSAARPGLAVRAFSCSSRIDNSPKAVKPGRHQAADVEGDVVSDYAKEDESRLSGVPGSKKNSDLLANRRAPQLFSLHDRTIVVTGGGRGLGMTVSQALLESGASVAAVDLLPEPSQPLWTEMQSYARDQGLSLSYRRLDVTNKEDVEGTMSKIFEEADSKAGAQVRGLLTAAGIQLLKPALEYTTQEFRKIVDVNLTGTYLCCSAFARAWLERNGNGQNEKVDSEAMASEDGGASIVMIGSMSGHVANFGLECAAYNASKAAVNQLGKNLAMEWGKKGIRVNTLSPGYIRTAMTATLLEQRPDYQEIWTQGSLLGRLSTPDEFRGPAIFLLSDASSFMTGADILVDGGHTAT